MITVIIILSLIFFSFSMVLAVFYAVDNVRPPLISWTLLACGLVYGLGWIAVIISVSNGKDIHGAQWIKNNEDYYIIHNLFLYSLVFGVLIGWHLFQAPARTVCMLGEKYLGL